MADIPDYDQKDDTGAAGALVVAVMTMHKITTCQADQQIPLKKKEGDGGKKGQDQRTPMAMNLFLTTMKALLCQSFLKKRADRPPLQRMLKKLLSLREHLQDEL